MFHLCLSASRGNIGKSGFNPLKCLVKMSLSLFIESLAFFAPSVKYTEFVVSINPQLTLKPDIVCYFAVDCTLFSGLEQVTCLVHAFMYRQLLNGVM